MSRTLEPLLAKFEVASQFTPKHIGHMDFSKHEQSFAPAAAAVNYDGLVVRVRPQSMGSDVSVGVASSAARARLRLQ